MPVVLATTFESTLNTVFTDFVTDIIGTLPLLLSGLLFLVLSYISIRVIRTIIRMSLTKIYGTDQELIVDLIGVIVSIFLWFGAALGLLQIIGMGEIAASLGTAAGFIGLGVAFALKNMIADTVAGVYLLRDPDFNIGDTVTTASVSGTITDIDLRKTRIRTESNDLVVIANEDVEKKWTQTNRDTTN